MMNYYCTLKNIFLLGVMSLNAAEGNLSGFTAVSPSFDGNGWESVESIAPSSASEDKLEDFIDQRQLEKLRDSALGQSNFIQAVNFINSDKLQKIKCFLQRLSPQEQRGLKVFLSEILDEKSSNKKEVLALLQIAQQQMQEASFQAPILNAGGDTVKEVLPEAPVPAYLENRQLAAVGFFEGLRIFCDRISFFGPVPPAGTF